MFMLPTCLTPPLYNPHPEVECAQRAAMLLVLWSDESPARRPTCGRLMGCMAEGRPDDKQATSNSYPAQVSLLYAFLQVAMHLVVCLSPRLPVLWCLSAAPWLCVDCLVKQQPREQAREESDGLFRYRYDCSRSHPRL